MEVLGAGAVVEEDKMNKYLIILVFILVLIMGSFFLKSNLTGDIINNIAVENLQKITLKVAIPCGGHAYLIKDALNKLEGIEKVEYTPITTFVVYYDSTKISEQEILAIDVFKDYPAKKIN